MGKHSQDELNMMIMLIKQSLTELLTDLGYSNNSSSMAASLTKLYSNHIAQILDSPHGGSLSPEELAEMVLLRHKKEANIGFEEASASRYAIR